MIVGDTSANDDALHVASRDNGFPCLVKAPRQLQALIFGGDSDVDSVEVVTVFDETRQKTAACDLPILVRRGCRLLRNRQAGRDRNQISVELDPELPGRVDAQKVYELIVLPGRNISERIQLDLSDGFVVRFPQSSQHQLAFVLL